MARAHAVMAVLARGERYGYDLRRVLEAELGDEWRLDFGQLYRLLAVMSAKKWVTARLVAGDKGPARKVYRLTARGRSELERWRAAPDVRAPRVRDEHVARLRLPPAGSRAATADAPLVAVGSDDLVLQLLRRRVVEGRNPMQVEIDATGSLGGLLALSQRRAHVAGTHLLDLESNVYNAPFVRHLLPEERVLLVHIAFREQGLMVAPGNPKHIRTVKDLFRRGIRLVNRHRGTGTRLLLFHHLRQAHLDPRKIDGYDRALATHTTIAAAIAEGTADVGPGIRAAAEQAGLEFIPLGFERYDLAIPHAIFRSPQLRPLLDMMHQRQFRREAAALPGYDTGRLGEIVGDVH